jgi:hypothetical protein
VRIDTLPLLGPIRSKYIEFSLINPIVVMMRRYRVILCRIYCLTVCCGLAPRVPLMKPDFLGSNVSFVVKKVENGGYYMLG